jgi:hypothetical protein
MGLVMTGQLARSLPEPARSEQGASDRGFSGTDGAASASSFPALTATPADTAWGWMPSPSASPGSLLVVDASAADRNLLAALAILQGLVNDRLPSGGQAAFLLTPPLGNCFPEEVFNLWPQIYSAQLGIGSVAGTAADLVALARERGVEQYVIWDPAVPATINVATTLAWLRGTAAFAPEDAVGALAAGLGLFLDLRALRLGTPAAAYRWALGEIAGSGPGALALLSVGDLPGDPSGGVLTWSVRDYAVRTSAFAWTADLRRLSFGGEQDHQLGEAILGTVGGRRATMFGWSNNERAQTVLSSGHGINFTGADSPGLAAPNITVHNAVRPRAVQRGLPRPPRLDKDRVYATVVFTDGDNIGVLLGLHEARWLAAQRGEVPVGWSMQGMAPSWVPGVARHYFESASFNDEMVAWLPFGYPDLHSFASHPRFEEYVASAHAAMAAAGLQVSQDLPHRNHVPSEEGSGLWQLLHGTQAPRGHFTGYQGPPGLYPVGEALWIDGRPVFPTGGYAPGGPTPSLQAISAIARAAAVNRNRPLFLVVGLGNCTTYEDALATVRAHFDVPVRFVLPSQLVRLQRQAWRSGLAGTSLLGLPVSANLDPYFLTDGDGQSVPALFRNEGVVSQARYVDDGGSWTYKFNVERCRALALSFTALGRGSLEATGDGRNWHRVAAVSAPPGKLAEVGAEVPYALPASHLWVRFTAAKRSRLAVTSFRLAYNAAPRRPRLRTRPLPAGSGLEVPQGPNLLAGVAPGVPADVKAEAARTAGSYRLKFEVPPGLVTLTGFGGSTWVTWPLPAPNPGGAYLFRLEQMTGKGKVFLDVWNGFRDLATREVSLSSTPRTVSLLVQLPEAVPSEALRAQLQVRTYDFPLEVSLTPAVYMVGPRR